MVSASAPRTPFGVKRIGIVGAGPAGLAAAKYLLARPSSFPHVTAFEQQAAPGGVWNYSATPPPPAPIPSTDPLRPPDAPLAGTDPPLFATPMYERLHANIPGTLMQFSDQKFPADAYLFPDRTAIRDYLVRYAEDVKHVIRFGWRVDGVTLRDQSGRDQWDVIASEVATGKTEQHTFDAVVVANGHFMTPFVPDIPGMREFHHTHPGVIQHARAFRAPEAYAGLLKIIIVGNGASGLDVARQISSSSSSTAHHRRRVFLSVRHATNPEQLAHAHCVEMPEIAAFLPCQRAVRFVGGDVVADIDAVLFCTGYLYNFTLLPQFAPAILKSGQCVHQMYKHLFHARHPTLVSPGLPRKVVPFPLCEAQMAAVAAVWANLVALPGESDMSRWCDELAREKGENLDAFDVGEDGRYINELRDWVARARKNGEGKEPPSWDDEKLWERTIFLEAKLEFERQGCKARTLAELGFHYGDHPR